MNKYDKGKYLLRHAFEGDYLPHDILMREKAAFSDAVGHSMVDYLKEYAETSITPIKNLKKSAKNMTHAAPLYQGIAFVPRDISKKYYPGQA